MEKVAINATKKKMTQVFKDDGKVIPVTAVLVDEGQDLDILVEGAPVAVSGKAKGKGFAGGVKRYGFAGGPKTHGQSDRHRAIGSIGAGTFPGKVWKGKKMPGRMGGENVTVKGLTIVRVFPEENVVYISGAVPGGVNNNIQILIETDAAAESDESSE